MARVRLAASLAILFAACLLASCTDLRACPRKVIESDMSPGRRFTVTTETSACEPGSFRIVLHDRGNMLDPNGLVAVVDKTDHVDVVWKDDDQIIVDLHGGRRHGARADWHGVDIAFRGKAPGDP